MVQMAASLELDFKSETYKDAYSRINAIVIEGEQEAHTKTILPPGRSCCQMCQAQL